MGRPSRFEEAVFAELCQRLAAGETLRAICRSDDKFPDEKTVRDWVIDNFNGVAPRYTRAREAGIHSMIDETISLSDDSSRDTITDEEGNKKCDNEWVARSRLRVDTRKWLASKVLPKLYGERLEQEISGPNGGAVTFSWVQPPPAK